jgi:transposase-like protein
MRYPTDVREIEDEDEAFEIARTLNTDRRHLEPEQRRPMVIALREEGHSYRAISQALGVGKDTIAKDVQLSRGRQLPDRVTGLDGKDRPAARPPTQTEPEKKRGLRQDKGAAWDVSNDRRRQIADGQKRRLHRVLNLLVGHVHRCVASGGRWYGVAST